MDRRHSSTIIPDIYQATINPDHWDMVLEKITKITRSEDAYLYYRDKIKGTASTFARFGSSTYLRQSCNKHFAELDKLFVRDLSDGDKGEHHWQFISPGVGNQSDIASEMYESWMKPEGLYYLGRIEFSIDHARTAYVVILRSEDAGVWQEGEIRAMNEIAPHLKRALDIHSEFTHLRLRSDALLGGLDRLVIGLILYDRHVRAVYINPTARAIIKSHPAMGLGEDGLFLCHSEEDKKFRQTIRETACIDTDDSWRQSISIGVTHPDVDTPLPLLITPINGNLLSTDLDYEGAQVAVFISDPNLQQPISIDNLVSVYGLTPSESQVAISIANGHSIDYIAKTSNHSAHTIRSQLKSTFRKTGVSRQCELVKLLLTGPFAHRRRSNAN